MEQVRMVQDASQAQRLQALLRFKEQFISETVPAQVIGTSGSEQSRLLFIDKGSSDGIRTDMAVVTSTGAVGKIVRVFPGTAQVLEINDQTSGVGAILEKSRLQGILKGTPSGDVMLHYVMSDEKVEVGEQVLTSGGDRIFPKGLPIGTVVSVNPGSDLFLNVRVKPAARLDRVEEVLVITKIDEKQPDLQPEGPQRAADILAARLPSVPVKPPDATTAQPGGANAQGQGTPSQQPQNQNAAKPQAGGVGSGAKPGKPAAKPTGTTTQQQ
jgi:rod shape-determining protein MreC